MEEEIEIWIELDEYQTVEEQSYDDDQFCNVIIHFADGSRIGLNVWSEKFFRREFNKIDWVDEQVAILPDLVVRKFDSTAIRKSIMDLINRDKWLEGRGFPIKDVKNSEDVRIAIG
ncbi:hypothetical protein [Leptolyngbya sp. FACHB-36]|uniref:hypothetical protein n=1 Tax=Leptolyngbya sp. FACHB-36 TaxID=2692808 RepID=UPI0016802079|nr:hypothetical protein [Leptolyngbya sp. FACHB-36]